MLTRQECYQILRLENSAGPNAIKQSYRKLAFELHPDLHPDLPDAARQFQQLNEAYVLLMREYANTSFSQRSRHGKTGMDETGTDARTQAEAHKTYQQAKERFETTNASFASDASSASDAKDENASKASWARRNSREELLRDLLNDPFARHVFEDIYSHVRHNEGKNAEPPPSRPPYSVKKTKMDIKPSERPWPLAVGSKMKYWAGGMKNWLRKQIDEEQVMFLHGESLYPGVRVRLQVRHGFSEKSRVVEFTLPPEFKPGSPIRLRGLGKRLGSLRGDLYLRVFEHAQEDKAEEK
ncbi:MAG: DnaJ domain-containing protein [Deltaproteobacteria bacterium]|jgi:molecular chaperone DnaJ|nr:DnaJ domain-containing protein [Deltaproteobacteria bacterium]